MGKIRDRMAERRLKRAIRKTREILDKIPIDVGDPMPNAYPMKKPKTIMASKGGRVGKSSGGSVSSRLSKAGPVAKPN